MAGTKRAAENLSRKSLDRSVLQGGTELQQGRGVGFRISNLGPGVSVYGIWFMVYGLWFMVYGLWFMVCGV